MRFVYLLLVFPFSLYAGSFAVDRSGALYSLRAEQALLSDILAEIDRQEPASLTFYGDYARPVSATYQNISLDRLLDKLGVSYVLVYETDEEGVYQLGDAMMLDSDAPSEDPHSDAAIKKLVRALSDDDVRFNAHHAYWDLMELGCLAVPHLEDALYDADFQGRHTAANLLRNICPEHVASDRLIEVTLELLTGDVEQDSESFELIWPAMAYEFLNQSNIYARARTTILANINSANRRVRLYSSMLAGNHCETAYAGTLVRTLVPHLADNDMRNDAAASAYALHQLGPVVLPSLQPYRSSDDPQQAELVDLIMTSLEQGSTPSFEPSMYVSYNKVPINDPNNVSVIYWRDEDFPDANGRYPNLPQPRMTTADYYGPYTYEEPDVNVEHESEHGPDSPFSYVVKGWETVDDIAVKFGVLRETIIDLNPKVNFNRPQNAGVVIQIPWE